MALFFHLIDAAEEYVCSGLYGPLAGPVGDGKSVPRKWFEDPVRKNLTVQCILLSRYSLLRRRAHGGFLLQTCAPYTLLLQVIYNHTC